MAHRKPPSDGDSRWVWQMAPAPGELRVVHAFVMTGEGRDPRRWRR